MLLRKTLKEADRAGNPFGQRILYQHKADVLLARNSLSPKTTLVYVTDFHCHEGKSKNVKTKTIR